MHANTQGSIAGKWRVHRDAVAHIFVIANIGMGDHFEGSRVGRLGDDVDHAGRCILAKEHALRTAQHLNALNVEDIVYRGAAEHDAVEHDRNRSFGGAGKAVCRDAANRVPRTQCGNRAAEIRNTGDVLPFKLRGADHVYRDRHVEQPLFTLRGRHDDIANRGFGFSGFFGSLARRRILRKASPRPSQRR